MDHEADMNLFKSFNALLIMMMLIELHSIEIMV